MAIEHVKMATEHVKMAIVHEQHNPQMSRSAKRHALGAGRTSSSLLHCLLHCSTAWAARSSPPAHLCIGQQGCQAPRVGTSTSARCLKASTNHTNKSTPAHLCVGQQGRKAARVSGGHQRVAAAVHDEHSNVVAPQHARQALSLGQVARALHKQGASMGISSKWKLDCHAAVAARAPAARLGSGGPSPAQTEGVDRNLVKLEVQIAIQQSQHARQALSLGQVARALHRRSQHQ